MLTDRESGRRAPATFRSEDALEQGKLEFLAVGHPLVDEAIEYFLTHERRRTVQPVRLPRRVLSRALGAAANSGVGIAAPRYYFVFLCHYLNGMQRSELMSCLVDADGNCLLPPELLIEPGADAAKLAVRANANSVDHVELRRAATKVERALTREASRRAEVLKDELHSIFKKEEYKLEISYGKKIRQIEEKLDRYRLRARLEPTAANRAQLTRTENELYKARHERELRVHRVRKESGVEPRLELLQVSVLSAR